MSSACSEIVWLHSLLHDFGIQIPSPTPLYAGNFSAIVIDSNLVYHEHTNILR